MNVSEYSAPARILPPVVINDVSLPPIEVSGQRVVTFAMIDRVHRRPDGTASRNFRENRAKLVAGEDYRELTQPDEIRRLGLNRPQGGYPAKVIVLTETGYLMLVKSLNDDLAWQVQKLLVKSYFRKRERNSSTVPTPAAMARVSREHRLMMREQERWAKMAGLIGNQALFAANKATAAFTGIDNLGLLGVAHIDAPQNEALLTPTDIGQRLNPPLSAKTVNCLLDDLGLQVSPRDHKGRVQHEPTEAGIAAGGVMQDTGKKHSDGAPVRQLRWASSIVRYLEDANGKRH